MSPVGPKPVGDVTISFTPSTMNREQWLTEVAKGMEVLFKRRGYVLKPYRVTCGWPVRNPIGIRRRSIGECHAAQSSKANCCELFISPLLEDDMEVAGVVMHELIHVAVGNHCGHKGEFVRACKVLGMAGPATQALPGDKLKEDIAKILKRIGPYPHQAIVLQTKEKKESKGSGVKVECKCGCNFRMSRKWIEESGIPTCGCGEEMEETDA